MIGLAKIVRPRPKVVVEVSVLVRLKVTGSVSLEALPPQEKGD